MPFSYPKIRSGILLYLQWSCLLSLFQSLNVPSLFLSFMTLALLKSTGQLFCSISLNLGFQSFLVIRLNGFIFGKNITEVTCPSQCIILGVTWCQYVLLLVIIIIGHLVKVVHDGFLLCKITIFPIVINKYLGEDTLRLGKYPVPPKTFSH